MDCHKSTPRILSSGMLQCITKWFFIFCWPCISLQILANNQLDAHFHVFIYFISLHVSSITALIIRGSNCINTSSDMISLCKWLLGMPVRHTKQSLTQTSHTRWCINTIRSPDDEHCDVSESLSHICEMLMYRIH